MATEILTIGHSTHPIDRFLSMLASQRVAALADVRRFPGSRRNPQFNEGALAASLDGAGIAYEALGEQLGGRRRSRPGSPNAGWQVDAFRAYADHMQEAEFAAGMERLEDLARERRTAVMCAEADWRRCHRRLVADALTVAGWQVLHVAAGEKLDPHELPPFAVIDRGQVTYPPAQRRLTD